MLSLSIDFMITSCVLILAQTLSPAINAEEAANDLGVEQLLRQAETTLFSAKEVQRRIIPRRAESILESLILTKAAAGMDDSDNSALKSIASFSPMKSLVPLERAMYQWRNHGVRPDLVDTLQKVNEAGGVFGRMKLVGRMMTESIAAGDTVATEQLLDFGLTDGTFSIDDSRDVPAGYYIGQYAGAAEGLALIAACEKTARAASLESLVSILDPAIDGCVAEGKFRNAMRLAFVIPDKDSSWRHHCIRHTVESGRILPSNADEIDSLLEGALVLSNVDEGDSIQLLYQRLLTDRRHDLIAPALLRIAARSPRYAATIRQWANDIEDLSGEITDIRRRLSEAGLSDLKRVLLFVALAEKETAHGDLAEGQRASEETARLVSRFPADEQPVPIKISIAGLQAAHGQLGPVLTLIEERDSDAIVQVVQMCRSCNRADAADRVLQAVFKEDQGKNQPRRFYLIEAAAKLGDSTSISSIVSSFNKEDERRSMVAESLISAGRHVADYNGVASAVAWTSDLANPLEKGAALIGIAQSALKAREPSYSPITYDYSPCLELHLK